MKTIIVITGPTASGKTALSIAVAKALNTVVISADSRQFYKEMTIGTAKPSQEEMGDIPHYFIDSHSIKNELSAAEFAIQADHLIDSLPQDKLILTGGSGMFIDALIDGLDEIPHDDDIRNELTLELERFGLRVLLDELKEKDPEYFNTVDQNNPSRIIRALTAIRASGQTYSSFRKGKMKDKYTVLRFIITMPREELYERINHRVDHMMTNGLLNEARTLLSENCSLVENTIGYKEFLSYLDGKQSLEETIEAIKQNSRRYAKRQLTWFRRYNDAYWIDRTDINAMKNKVLEKIV